MTTDSTPALPKEPLILPRAASVAETIARRNVEAAGALIGYLPVGFPDLDTSIEAAIAMAENGVDAIELGLPYSDPVMDGPVIQAATQQAIAKGFKLRHGFEAVAAIRERVDVPVLVMTYWNPVLQYGVVREALDPVLQHRVPVGHHEHGHIDALVMTYWNPVLQYGVERFANDLSSAGGAGLITPDLIPDEGAEWMRVSEELGLDRVFLAAPSSTDTRLAQAVEASRGFVYAVSTMGITGARADVDKAARVLIERLRAVGSTSACVGVGISTGEQVREILAYADGAIVGSALVRALADGGVEKVAETSAALAAGTASVAS